MLCSQRVWAGAQLQALAAGLLEAFCGSNFGALGKNIKFPEDILCSQESWAGRRLQELVQRGLGSTSRLKLWYPSGKY